MLVEKTEKIGVDGDVQRSIVVIRPEVRRSASLRPQLLTLPSTGTSNPFLPADLNTLFPPEYLPAADAKPEFDLVSFAGLYGVGKVGDPNASGVAFVLFAGTDTALSKMKKKDNVATGIEFINCPEDGR